MREGTTTYLALLAVELYEVSEKFIYDIRENQHVNQNIFDNLPEFTINSNKEANNQPIVAEFFHQFAGTLKPDGEGQKYLFFNLTTLDSILHEEIANSGADELFTDFDFIEILSRFKPEPKDHITNFVFPNTNYLVVELVYTTSIDRYSGGYDCDMDIDIVGYLDNKMMRRDFKSGQEFKEGDVVKLPHEGKGEVVEFIDLPWASKYIVKITESETLYDVGELHDFFEKHLELDKE